MLKNALFLEKSGKMAAALGPPPPNPVGLLRLGLETPELLPPQHLLHCSGFSVP